MVATLYIIALILVVLFITYPDDFPTLISNPKLLLSATQMETKRRWMILKLGTSLWISKQKMAFSLWRMKSIIESEQLKNNNNRKTTLTDRFSGKSFTDPQSDSIKKDLKARKFSKKDETQEKAPTNLSELYNKGIEHLKTFNFTVELDEGGDHVKHRILKPAPPVAVLGVNYPASFQPLQEISSIEDFQRIERAFESADTEVRDFWTPMFRPKGGETDLLNFAERMLKMKRIQQNINIHDVLDFGHTFDPDGTLTGNQAVRSPRIWVPARSWFDEKLHEVTLADVFTIFPDAECEMLKMIIGRVGVGRSNHRPPNFLEPIDHTARMAAVIVGKDAGLGKSTIFNGLTAALSKCGFLTHTFKSTEDRFGLKQAALADIAYKDDTAMKSLKAFLAAEETKILITNGLFQTEEKFQNSEQIWPKCVMLVNSNDWDAHFAYDLGSRYHRSHQNPFNLP